jgi:hypothetical protein
MAYFRAPGKEMLIWGNALFYSPNGGQTVLFVSTFGSGVSVTHCATSKNGYFACSTSDNQVGTRSILLLDVPDG